MAEIVDLLEYKKKKEQQELDVISALQQELRDIIAEMGGIHTVPMMMTDESLTSLDTGYTWSTISTSGFPTYYIDCKDEEH